MRDVPERHRSLRAVFDYSWNLLAPEEQTALSQLSVFRGDFERQAARDVAAATLPLLAALVDSSLVRRNVLDNGQIRYQLLEVVRQYAEEKLTKNVTEARQVHDRHCYYYLIFLESRQTHLQGDKQPEALAGIGAEIENVRAGWRWAVSQRKVELIERALVSLFHFYDMRSWFQEGEDVFRRTATAVGNIFEVDGTPENRRTWGRLLARQGWFMFYLGRQREAKGLLERSLAVLRPLNTPAPLIFPSNYLAAVEFYLGAYDVARQFCQQSLELCQVTGNLYGAAIANNILGQIAYRQKQYDVAQHHSRQSLRIEQSIGNRWSMGFSLTNLGNVAYALGAYEEAESLFRQSLAIGEEMGDQRGVARCLNHLAETAVAKGDHAEAEQLYQKSLEIFRDIGNQWGMTSSLKGLGNMARQQGRYEQAKAYFDDALQRAVTIQAMPRIQDILQELASLLAELGDDSWQERLADEDLMALVEEVLTTAV
jgi:tetratricopeptide (TPR) repeat protein